MKKFLHGLLFSILVLGLVNDSAALDVYAEDSTSKELVETSVKESTMEQEESIQEDTVDSTDISEQEEGETIESSEIANETSSTSDISSKENTDTSSLSEEQKILSVEENLLDLENCQYIENTDGSITLTGYTGDKTELVIPSQIIINEKRIPIKVRINGGNGETNETPIPLTVHSVTFQSVEGTKVGLDSNGNWNNLFNVSNKIYNNLTSIDFSGLDMASVISMNTMFNYPHVPNLEMIKFGDNALSNVTDMGNAFNELVNLRTIEQNWTLGSITNFNNTFFNCQSLTNLDLTRWDVSKVTNFENMFYNCISLKEFRMDTWGLNQTANIKDMFYLYDISQPVSALIVASDPNLLAFDYSYAGYKPSCEIRINANTGQLVKNEYQDFYGRKTGLSYYFDKVVISTEQYQELESSDSAALQAKLQEWLEENVPTKSGYALAGWAPTDETFEQQIQAITTFDQFLSSQAEFKAEWVRDNFSTSTDNTKLTPLSTLGLAYYPKGFVIGSVDLKNSGEQRIPIPKTMSLNLGIKDRTRTKDFWTVTAQLIWNGESIPNAYIQTNNSTGTVMQNVSTGDSAYQETDLQEYTGSITGMKDYIINQNASPIIESKGTSVNNGVYDYSLGDVELVIPDVSIVAAQTYEATINWNITVGP